MKVGDLVSVVSCKDGEPYIGVVIDEDYEGLNSHEVLVLWNDEKIEWELIEPLEVINESR